MSWATGGKLTADGAMIRDVNDNESKEPWCSFNALQFLIWRSSSAFYVWLEKNHVLWYFSNGVLKKETSGVGFRRTLELTRLLIAIPSNLQKILQQGMETEARTTSVLDFHSLERHLAGQPSVTCKDL